MKLNLDPEVSWDCPEGTYIATLVEVREVVKPSTTSGSQKLVRLVYQIDALSNEAKYVYVGKNFPPSLKKGSALRTHLEVCLGEAFFESNRKGNKLDLKDATGTKSILYVHRIENEGYDKPYCNIQPVGPATTRTATPQTPTATNDTPATETTTATPRRMANESVRTLTRLCVLVHGHKMMMSWLTMEDLYEVGKNDGLTFEGKELDYMDFEKMIRQAFNNGNKTTVDQFELRRRQHEIAPEAGKSETQYLIKFNRDMLEKLGHTLLVLKTEANAQDFVLGEVNDQPQEVEEVNHGGNGD